LFNLPSSCLPNIFETDPLDDPLDDPLESKREPCLTEVDADDVEYVKDMSRDCNDVQDMSRGMLKVKILASLLGRREVPPMEAKGMRPGSTECMQ
jgi:hypothetical protein